jgi:lysyl-tRNA synthetase class 2
MSSRRDEFYRQRRAKLARLRGRGIDPYPPRYRRTHTAAEALRAFQAWEEAGAANPAPDVRVAGRITAMRDMGGATFVDLRDGSGKLQAHLRRDALGDEAYEGLRDLDLGDFLGVAGALFRTRSGELTVDVQELVLLAKALLPPPEKWHGLADVETRYRQRYLDLMANEEVRDLFTLRTRAVSAIRRFMDGRGFLEVETPILQPKAGGAAARPFVTNYEALDRDFYLRIATELHLKRLIVGGFDRVYEMGRVFRNEGLSTRHNPEFTLLESYEAYADYNAVAAMVEEMVSQVAQELLGTTRIPNPPEAGGEIDLSPPWRRLTVVEGLRQYAGLDLEAHWEEAALRAAVEKMGIEVPPGVGWAKLVDEVLATCVEPRLIEPAFLMDYPAALSPLAKKKPEDPRFVERFEPFVAGIELGNAYTELNDPLEQQERFREQARRRAAGDEEAERGDEDFLRALEHGMPPTGGLGLGIDRLVMVLTGQRAIRQVILFPQLRTRGRE